MMITKNDWLAAADEYMASERSRLEELPTPEEVVAYAHGELDDGAARRVRAALVYEPALTDLLIENVPDNVVPMASPRRSHRWMGVAAMVVLAVTAMLMLRNPGGPEQSVELRPSQYRGASAPRRQVVYAGGSQYHFTALLLADRDYRAYSAALLDADGDEVWDTNDVKRDGRAIVRMTIPGRNLKPGSYTIAVYGDSELLQSYPIDVETPQ